MNILILRLLETLNIPLHTLRIRVSPQVHDRQPQDMILDAVRHDVVVQLDAALLVLIPVIMELLALDFLGCADECDLHVVVFVVIHTVVVGGSGAGPGVLERMFWAQGGGSLAARQWNSLGVRWALNLIRP